MKARFIISTPIFDPITAMASKRRRVPFWRRRNPDPRYDIALLRGPHLPSGQRFETLADVHQESERSETLLRSSKSGKKEFAEYLEECRAGDHICGKPYCPICARLFRRWCIGELLRVTAKLGTPVQIFTILLEEVPRTHINNLDLNKHRHRLRKQLERAGLIHELAIGGFELVYTRSRTWMLHVNLMVAGGSETAVTKFNNIMRGRSATPRPVELVPLRDRAAQLSYLLKFTTYHRPHKQHAAWKPRAKPLNPAEHYALVKWMAQYDLKDFLFLFNARREGSKIILR